MNNYKTKKVMKKLASLLTCICLILSTTACSQSKNYSSGNWGSKKVIASNKYVTKDIKVDNFKKISVAGSPDVTFTQKSGRPEVEVYTSDNIVDLLDIKVKDNTLYIKGHLLEQGFYLLFYFPVSWDGRSHCSLRRSGQHQPGEGCG